jgi:hypothetical protein
MQDKKGNFTLLALASCLTVNPNSAHTLRQYSMADTLSRKGFLSNLSYKGSIYKTILHELFLKREKERRNEMKIKK